MAQGLFGGIVIAGPAIGPTLGGYLTTNVDWRWIFYVNVPVGIGAMIMCAIHLVPDTKKEIAREIDWLAIGLLALGLGSLQTVLEEGQTDDWFESSFILTFAVLAAVGTALFVWRTLRSRAPVVDLRVLRYRSLWAGSIISVILGMGLYGTLFAVPIFAQSVLDFTSQQTGLLLLPGAIASAVTMPFAAINHGADGQFAYVVNQKNSTVEARPVQVNSESGDTVIVTSGLSAGEVVVTSNQFRLQPGTKVKVAPAAVAAAPAHSGQQG